MTLHHLATAFKWKRQCTSDEDELLEEPPSLSAKQDRLIKHHSKVKRPPRL